MPSMPCSPELPAAPQVAAACRCGHFLTLTGRKRFGFQQSDLFVRLSAHHAAAVFFGAAEVAEPGAAGGEPVFLRLGRAGVYHHYVRVHLHRLYPRSAGGEVPG